MKKKIMATIVSVILALVIFVSGVYAGVNYVEWSGTSDMTRNHELRLK